MADEVYNPGALVPLEATFRNAAEVPTNTTVTLTVRDPAGVVTNPTPTNLSAGVYHYDLPVTTTGLWSYAFIGTGAVTATKSDTFVVEPLYTSGALLSTRALVSIEEARRYVFNDVTDDTGDRRLAQLIGAYSEAVFSYTSREWLPQTTGVTRKFRYSGGMVHLNPYDLRTATSIVLYTDYPTAEQMTLVAGTTTVEGEYRLRPFGGDPRTGTYRWLDFTSTYGSAWFVDGDRMRPSYWGTGFEVSITGNWGIATSAATVPEDVKLAVLIAVDNAVKNPEGAATRTFGELTTSEIIETSPTGQRWMALPGESRALLIDFRDEAPVFA